MKRLIQHTLATILVLSPVAAQRVAASENRIPGDTWLKYISPEEAGFSSKNLDEARAYYDTIQAAAVLVIYRGAVLADWGETARRFRMHSARKSLMSALYGIHIDNGNIDTNLTLEQLNIDESVTPLTAEEKQARIADLLAARSGVYLQAAYEPASNPKPERGSFPPGTNWCYNNWDFNTLVTILEQEAKVKVFEEFDRKLARPLGMQDYDPSHGYYHYEREKSMHPAYPFRMSARDMARLGLLNLYNGRWGEKQVLSAAYVKQSTSWISDSWRGGYGYMWWLPEAEPFKTLGMYTALGLGEQSIDVIPGADMVFVLRTNTYENNNVSKEERYQLIRMILDARIGQPRENPVLEPVADPEPGYQPRPNTSEEMAVYANDYPLGQPGLTFRVYEQNGQLVAEEGEGPIPFHKLGPDHFIIEDHNAHIYFENGPDGGKQLIAAHALQTTAVNKMRRGEFIEAISVLSKAVTYFPNDPDLHGLLGDSYLYQAAAIIDTAVIQYSRVHELRPERTLDRTSLGWWLSELYSHVIPVEQYAWDLDRFAGTYGPRTVEYEAGRLFYSREDRDGRHPLVPLTESIFAIEEMPYFRLVFHTDPDGNVYKLTGLYQDGRSSENLRDQ